MISVQAYNVRVHLPLVMGLNGLNGPNVAAHRENGLVILQVRITVTPRYHIIKISQVSVAGFAGASVGEVEKAHLALDATYCISMSRQREMPVLQFWL